MRFFPILYLDLTAEHFFYYVALSDELIRAEKSFHLFTSTVGKKEYENLYLFWPLFTIFDVIHVFIYKYFRNAQQKLAHFHLEITTYMIILSITILCYGKPVFCWFVSPISFFLEQKVKLTLQTRLSNMVKHIPFSYIFLFQTKAQPEQNYLQKSSKLRRYAFQIQNPTYLYYPPMIVCSFQVERATTVSCTNIVAFNN